MKKLLTLLLCACLFLSTARDALAAEPTPSYERGLFTDVAEDAWYGEGGQGIIRGVVESGLMTGMGDGSFGIDKSVTISQAVAMAARARALRFGGGYFDQGNPWYRVYIDYAVESGIILPGEFTDFEREATRAELAHIFARALPESDYPRINNITSLPDVSVSDPYGADIFLLYRAGVLTGRDGKGAFSPDAYITRQEAAAVLLRVVNPSRRISLPEKPPLFSYKGFVWESDYSYGMDVSGYENWYNLAWAAYYNLVPEYAVTLKDAVFDFSKFSSFMYDDYNTLTFYCGNPDWNGLIEVRQVFGSFDYLSAAFRNRRVLDRLPEKERALCRELDYIIEACVKEDMTDIEKARALHDYMVRHFDYDPGVASGGDPLFGDASWSFMGLLRNGYGVCQAYMELYYLLCTRIGLDCGIVTGKANGGEGWEDHGWNVLRFEGNDTPYYVDVTFDDPMGGGDKVSYDYFMVTADKLSSDHSWRMPV